MQKLKVVYTGDHNKALDEAIKNFFKKFDFVWTGQGMDLTTGERDICFERGKKEG